MTKKIPVTQRPDRGTIKVSEHKLIFCPKVHEKRSVEVKSIGGDWIFLGSSPKATSDIQEMGKRKYLQLTLHVLRRLSG